MALPEDFNKIFGSTATGGLTPIGDVNYAKGWEFVGLNPPTKNDFSYLQNISDLKAQYLYKAIGGESGAPAIGIPFFWPSSAMPNTVMTEWSDMVFLKFNGATFSASTYPKLALIIPSLTLPDARGEFPRIWDDGRGVDSGRELLSSQGGGAPNITGTMTSIGVISGVSSSGAITGLNSGNVSNLAEGSLSATFNFSFDASRSSSLYQSISEVRPRNIAFNLLVRAK